MAPPNPNTAVLLDAVIQDIDRMMETDDLGAAALEFSVGAPEAPRLLDACWGFDRISPFVLTSADPLASNEIVFANGLIRHTDDGDTLDNSVLIKLASQTGYNLSALTGTLPVQDAYAFGAAYLTLRTGVVAVEVGLAKGSIGSGAEAALPILMARDVEIDALLHSSAGTLDAPAGADAVLEIGRFILDIKNYIAVDDKNNQVTIHLQDARRLRGWAGYAEEQLAVNLVPALFGFHQNSAQGLTDLEDALKRLIFTWWQLPSWSPSFVGYWTAPGNALPTRLNAYLLETFGLIV